MSKQENNTLWFAQLNVFFWAPKEDTIEREYFSAVNAAKKNYGPYCLSDPSQYSAAVELIQDIPGEEMDCQQIYGEAPKSLENLGLPEVFQKLDGVEKYITHNGRKYKLVE